MPGEVVFGQRGVLRLNRQRSTIGHRVARVDDEVHQHLLHLSVVSADEAEIRVEPRLQQDVLAEYTQEHAFHLADDAVQVEERRLEDLLPAEGEQLSRQRGCPLRGAPDLLDVAPPPILVLQIAEQQLAAARHDGEQVVEVVGDAAGEPSDRLHLLRLAELFLEMLALAHLEHQRADA